MRNAASGANVAPPFNPAIDTHYALSEGAEFELRDLFDAMAAIGQLMDTPLAECGPEIEPAHLAPLFRTFGRHGKRILTDCPARLP